jgi:peroxiredoxin
LLAISVQDVDDLTEFYARAPAPVTLLSDSDRKVTQEYNAYNALSLEGFRIAHPAAFIIDPQGVVQWSYVGSNQFEWPKTDIVAEKLAAARASAQP